MKLYIVCGDEGIYANREGTISLYTDKLAADLSAATRAPEGRVVEVKITAVLPEKVAP